MITVALQGIRGGVGTSSIVAGWRWRPGSRGPGCWLVDRARTTCRLHLGRPHDEPCGWGLLADPARQWRDGAPLLARIWICWLRAVLRGLLSVDWLSAVEGYDLVLLDLPAGVTPVAESTQLLTVVNADANCHTRLYRHHLVPQEQVVVTQFTSRRALQQDLLDLWMEGGLPLLSIRLHRDEVDGGGDGGQIAGR
ncbi:cellulose synthase operon protein YhjQ/BcsQ [Aeromonas sp. A-5]|uniref:cellulose synthase operon protein YhjQ/BcsQ n=1 Tax=Aeromonas ichthyocola TaxID=3367746 RepID=UPI0038F55EAA